MADKGLEAETLELGIRRLEADLEIRRAEIEEKRAQRESDVKKHAIDSELKRLELNLAAGRGLKFTTAQATVAAAMLALMSGAIGGFIQAWMTSKVEASKSDALVKIEEIKAKASIDLDRQKFETSLIGKATESPRREEQIRNLKFYLAAGFLSDPQQKIAKMREQDYPSSPPPTATRSAPLPAVGSLPTESPFRVMARSIGMLLHKDDKDAGLCTAWLVDASHVVTSSICVSEPVAKWAKDLRVRLGFVAAGEQGDTYPVTGIVERDEKLGYAILALDQSPGTKYGRLPLSVRTAERGEDIFIIQHAGDIQLLAAENCRVVDASVASPTDQVPVFSHKCRQEYGSAGAPVVAKRDNAILGIVHAGDKELEFAAHMKAIAEKSALLKRLMAAR